MSIITESRQVAAEHLFVLSRTRKIEVQDLQLPEWKLLAEEYLEHERSEWLERAIISLINSLFFQRVVFFLMSRRSFRKLCRTDRNWKKSIGLKDENFKKLIQEAVLRKFILVEEKLPNDIWVWKVVHPALLSHITVDIPAQKAAVTAYAKLFKSTDDLPEGTSKGNQDKDKDIEREKDETVQESCPVLNNSFKNSPGGHDGESKENCRVGKNISFSQMGADSNRVSAIANAQGVPKKSLAMMRQWESRGYPNGLSGPMLKTLADMEAKYLLVSPTGEKLDSIGAYCLLSDFVQTDPWLDETDIKEAFIANAGDVVARSAFEECEKHKNGPNLKWIINHHRESAKKKSSSAIPNKPEVVYQNAPGSRSTPEGRKAFNAIREYISSNPSGGSLTELVIAKYGRELLTEALIESDITSVNLWNDDSGGHQ